MVQRTTPKDRIRVTIPVQLGREKDYIVLNGQPPYLNVDTNPGGITLHAKKEVLHSTGHRGPPFKDGGPFSVRRYEIRRTVGSYTGKFLKGAVNPTPPLLPSYDICTYSGVRWHTGDFSGVPLIVTEAFLKNGFDNMSIPTQNLQAYGDTAIHKFSPLNPGASLGVGLVELYRDGLPKTPANLLRRLRELKDAGRRFTSRTGEGTKVLSDEYLNYQFAWKPLLNDIRELYVTQTTLNKRLSQIIRDNNKGVRREGTLYRNRSTVADPNDGIIHRPSPLFNSEAADPDHYPWDGTGGFKTVTTSERIWFSGRFRYYIPDVTDDRWTRKAKLALFGLNPSPSLIWNVLPWSWLVDWFTNVGDVISNLSANGIGDVFLDYGYVMRHYKKDTEYVVKTIPTRIDYYQNGKVQTLRPVSAPHRTLIREEQKQRVVATPFGFDLQLQDLSTRQFAILTALGLSRLNFRE